MEGSHAKIRAKQLETFCQLYYIKNLRVNYADIVTYIVMFLFHCANAGKSFSIAPVVWFTELRLIRLVNRTFGGFTGYSGPQVILNSNNLPSKCVCQKVKRSENVKKKIAYVTCIQVMSSFFLKIGRLNGSQHKGNKTWWNYIPLEVLGLTHSIQLKKYHLR